MSFYQDFLIYHQTILMWVCATVISEVVRVWKFKLRKYINVSSPAFFSVWPICVSICGMARLDVMRLALCTWLDSHDRRRKGNHSISWSSITEANDACFGHSVLYNLIVLGWFRRMYKTQTIYCLAIFMAQRYSANEMKVWSLKVISIQKKIESRITWKW